MFVVFRFISFNPALCGDKNKMKDYGFPICFTKET